MDKQLIDDSLSREPFRPFRILAKGGRFFDVECWQALRLLPAGVIWFDLMQTQPPLESRGHAFVSYSDIVKIVPHRMDPAC